MASKTFRAVYKDAAGQPYSCPVELHDGTWMLVTTSGLAPITHTLDNEEYGIVTFDSYREEPDTRLHIDRLPGESSFGALRRAYAEKEIAFQRQQRQAARTQIQDVPPDPAKIAAARELNNEIAKTMKPRGGGAGLVVNPPMSQAEAEIQARLRRR